jgi:hypothetical protein
VEEIGYDFARGSWKADRALRAAAMACFDSRYLGFMRVVNVESHQNQHAAKLQDGRENPKRQRKLSLERGVGDQLGKKGRTLF